MERRVLTEILSDATRSMVHAPCSSLSNLHRGHLAQFCLRKLLSFVIVQIGAESLGIPS